jgi:hypothetical protein
MTFEEIERSNPEWGPWLGALRELLAELDNPAWDAAVPELRSPSAGAPLVAAAGIDPAEVPIPLLHACRRRWSVPKGWSEGYCPVCGAWPGFAEVRGVERARHLRCVRCGSGWRAHARLCPYCSNSDHDRLAALVLKDAPKYAIDVCRSCNGYLKVFTVLGPAPPEQALLEDLASVELDIAAEARGYRRPVSSSRSPGPVGGDHGAG